VKLWLALGAALLMVTANLAACSSSGPVRTTDARSGRPTEPQPSSRPASTGVPYSLYTHCGIREARLGPTYYVADNPVDGGSGNPPAGWGNPYQPGTMTTLSPSVAIFRDDLGHVVHFHARPGATRFLQICS
jgi:hypothetical protein